MTTVATALRTFPSSARVPHRQAYFTLNGRPFTSIETKGGKIEVYRIVSRGPRRGLEMWQCYVGDATVPAKLAIAAVEALCPVRRP